ncbi:hypothetical protein C6P46_003673 [Rhodotorula mucilaginosa]|uniref:Uncharacterized protein n=1 Tax=Rhodotorula mucilaginosa TaxID=5537 RepID=A0A9P7B792_RHOMI|nr:hypothetical protein C6P46_003673 [Rhodotorula mucilaginosa]
MPALLQPRIGVTSRNLYLTPEIGQTPHINVTPNINTTPTLSGTPRTSLTPLYHNSPIHSPDQRDFAGIEAACLACEEVIERGLAEWHRLNPPTAALSPAHPSWSRKKAYVS